MKKGKDRPEIRINPERYKMIWCPRCKGTGKLSDSEGEIRVCPSCGGFGWVKKGEDNERIEKKRY